MLDPTRDSKITSKRVWATLITNEKYLPGLLTLAYSLQRSGTKYPLVALYIESTPASTLAELDARHIPRRLVPRLMPCGGQSFTNEARFADTWTKLAAFAQVEFDRVVLLDSDMLVRRNLDELMSLELDAPGMNGEGNRVFAACHACVCNPLKRTYYPMDWIPLNCAYTTQHPTPAIAQIEGPPPSTNIGMLNSGLLVINPSMGTYRKIEQTLDTPELVAKYDFPDQALLSDVFAGRWVALPYVYNALKSLRWEGVHDAIWRDEEVKVVHYIFAQKPWHNDRQEAGKGMSTSNKITPVWIESDVVLHRWWWNANTERERKR